MGVPVDQVPPQTEMWLPDGKCGGVGFGVPGSIGPDSGILMSEAYETVDRVDDLQKDRPKVDLYDPWQRQFTSRNKQNEFRKAMESSGTAKT
jgi:hypothetical protein